jgi:hypothetical protein
MPADRLCLIMVPSRHAYSRARARSDAPGIRRGAARSGIRSLRSQLVHPGSHCKKSPASQVPNNTMALRSVVPTAVGTATVSGAGRAGRRPPPDPQAQIGDLGAPRPLQ